MAYPNPKYREVRETRVSRAAQRRQLEELELLEAMEEPELIAEEEEAELASFYNMIDEDESRDMALHIEEMARYDAACNKDLDREAQAARDNDFFFEKDLKILSDWFN